MEHLVRLPDEFAHHRASLPDFEMHYVREGSGTPLLLWHGWPGFWWDWRHVIGPLAEHFDVIVPDFRGAGDTDKTDLSRFQDYSIGQLADDQAALMDALGIEKAMIVGHDFGSMTAHKFLRQYPERIIKAVLLDPVTPYFSSEDGRYSADDWYYLFTEQDVAADLVGLNRDTRRIYYRHFYDVWSNGKASLSEQEFEIIIDNYMKPGNVLGGMNYDRANLGPRAKPWNERDYEKSDVPLAVLWSEGDPSVPASGSEHLPDLYSNYTLDMIPGGGHFIMLDQPEVIARQIIEKLS